ncbi:MAG: aromatic aminobenezylarsenical efflux permease ArsG family transporter [Bacteroidota bacterium]|nr:aromatic aminobenezylarsenical efflux permease ArsG family transporter [Bacteroidota bacterium]
MTGEFAGALLTSLWLGVLTAISPCPLATNIAAIGYVGKTFGHPRGILISGLLYTIGRSIAYIVLASLIVAGLLSVFTAARTLQVYANLFLGPLLIVTGFVLLEIIPLPMRGKGAGSDFQGKIRTMGYSGSFILGVLFAVSFCPVSAALFFGSLIPLALRHGSTFSIPGIYGITTAVPVIVFTILLAAGSASLSRIFKGIQRFELIARRVTAVIFILIGVYYALLYIFKVTLF